MIRPLLFFILILVIGFLLGPTVIESPLLVVGFALALFFLFLALTNFETGLMILLFVIPFSVQINLSKKGGLPVDMGADDFFIFFLVVVWFVWLGKTKQAPFVKNPLTWPFIAYLAACLISFIPMMLGKQGEPAVSLLHLVKWFEYVFIYFVVVKCLEDPAQIRRFCLLAVLSALLLALTQVLGMILGVNVEDASSIPFWMISAYESSGIMGAFYMFFLSILISFLMRLELPVRTRFYLLALCFVFVLALYGTYVRAAYLAMIVSLVLMGVIYRRKLLFLGLFLVFAAPALFDKRAVYEIGSTVQSTSSLDRLKGVKSRSAAKYYQSRGGLKLDLSSVERLIAWGKARNVIYHHPLFGTGYWTGRFTLGFALSTAHNWYITVLLETGLFGLLSFLWICWAAIFNAFVFYWRTKDPFYQALAMGYALGFIGILVHCFFGETFEAFRLTGPLWLVSGIVFAAKRLDENTRMREAADG